MVRFALLVLSITWIILRHVGMFALSALKLMAKLIAFVVLLGFLFSANAHAESDEEWGCKVLMCLANTKGGPKAHHDCVDPIDRLYREVLRPPRGNKPRSFPRCNSAGGGNGTQMGSSYFDPCPQGTVALTAGLRATQLTSEQFQVVSAGRAQINLDGVVVGIGEGVGSEGLLGRSGERKFCVSGQVGSLTVGTQEESYSIVAFERIVVQDPASSPNYIDVYVGNQKHTRVRY